MENSDNKKRPEVSVVVPISERHDDMRKFYTLYADELKSMGKDFEFIFVVDGQFPQAYGDLKELKADGNPIQIIKYSRNFGESNALMEGFELAKGDKIITLASYFQVEPNELQKVFKAYGEGNELVITRRYPRRDPIINRIQSYLYHFLVRKMTGVKFNDITSGMRIFDKTILSEFVLYGDLHRFIPVIAHEKGIKIAEVNVKQRKEDTQVRLVKPGIYVGRVLDLITLFFLIKFTKRPLRFFGLIGTTIFIPGIIITAYLGILRVAGMIHLANKPLLLLGLLMIVFGLQLFSVGLIGELILFTHAKNIESYSIKKIID